MVTGGIDVSGSSRIKLKSGQFYDTAFSSICATPDFPEARYEHTQIEKIVCGGVSSTTSGLDNCLQLISGSWEVSHTLKQGRRGHAMWLTPEKKILLIGGTDSLDTTEILRDDGASDWAFNLKHGIKYSCLIDEISSF